MSTAHMIKLVFVVAGVVIMIVSFLLHAKRKLTVNLALVWEFLGFAILIVGAVPAFSEWCYLLAKGTAIAMLIVAIPMLWGAYTLCVLISVLSFKNQELAMQVSLLNQENEILLRKHGCENRDD